MIWSIIQINPGLYNIINQDNLGHLSYTEKRAASGPYIQVLSGKNYEKNEDDYKKGGRWEKCVIWEINEAFKT